MVVGLGQGCGRMGGLGVKEVRKVGVRWLHGVPLHMRLQRSMHVPYTPSAGHRPVNMHQPAAAVRCEQ